jgi:hypothetical protein
MHLRNSSIVPLLLFVFSLAGPPALAADQAFSTEAPSAPKAAAEALRLPPGAKAALRIELGEADAGEIASIRKANSEQFHKKLQIGVGRDVPADAKSRAASLRWQSVAGGYAAQWEIASTGARALRIELEAGKLPAGLELRFASAALPGVVYGPFTAADLHAVGMRYWSPVLEGERAIVEAFLPSAKLAELPLAVTRVSHLFASPSDRDMDILAKDGSQFCEVDFICRSASDSALASTGRAVARMSFTDGVSSGTFTCTGTLLNTTAGAVAPYFYSANHCISTQVSASTLTTHWFYDRQNCGSGSTVTNYTQVTGGATLLYNNATTDVLLLRLNQNPPSGAVYAGWNANTLGTGTALTAVHHPAGDWKKVSLATAGGFSAYGGGTGDTHLIALWNSISTGVTEGGSSGSGIFSYDASSGYQLRGGLHGGPSSCSATGADLRDYYSRFDRAYSFLAGYLNPGTTCTYSLSPTSATVGSAGGSGSFTVTTQSGCTWSASSNASWLTSGSSGSGSGTATYAAAANSGAARTGTITVGGQAFTVTQQASSGGTSSELVSNGGFESGGSVWTQTSTSGAAVIYTNGAASRTGTGYAWLGGYNSGTDAIYQNVAIPAGASPVTLRFWYRITTSDSPADAYDFLRVRIQNTAGTTLATVATYSNQSATSGWVQSPAIDLSGYAGQTIRLRFEATMDDSLTTSFYIDDISISATTSGGTVPNYTGLWWNFPALSENGWGINFTHQANVVFATLFTYDSTGAPLWLVMSAGDRLAGTETFTGTLYRTRGPAFNAVPFAWDPNAPGNLTTVGTMTVTFTAADRATLAYTVDGVAVTKTVTKQIYGSRAANCVDTTGSRAGIANYQDLWWNPGEPGWGVNVTHQDNTLFATLFTYDSTGRDLWLVLANGARQADGSYSGTLYQTTGPVFNAQPWIPATANPVGTMRFGFSNGENGTLTYTYNGVTVTKSITRQVLRGTATHACS